MPKRRDTTKAANAYHSYMRGWRDGSSTTAMRSEFDQIGRDTDRAYMREAYEAGYNDGGIAKSRASRRASRSYGRCDSLAERQLLALL